MFAVHDWLADAVQMPTLTCYHGLLFRHPDAIVPCLLCLTCLLAVATEVRWGVRGSLGILEGPQLLLGGGTDAHATAMGGAG